MNKKSSLDSLQNYKNTNDLLGSMYDLGIETFVGRFAATAA